MSVPTPAPSPTPAPGNLPSLAIVLNECRADVVKSHANNFEEEFLLAYQSETTLIQSTVRCTWDQQVGLQITVIKKVKKETN